MPEDEIQDFLHEQFWLVVKTQPPNQELAFTQALGVLPVFFLKKSLKTDLELKPLS